jgi:cell shape-determining protein MreC
MTMYDHAPAERFSALRARMLAALLAVAIVLMLLPRPWTRRLQQCIDSAMRPGQIVATSFGEAIDASLSRLRGLSLSSRHYADLERQLARLRTRNAQLEAAAAQLAHMDHNQTDGLPLPAATTPLVTARLVEARIIGRHLQSLLADEATLDLGAASGIKPGAWTLDAQSCLIDQGSAAELRRGKLVLAGRRVLGKIAATTTYTSRVQRPADAGYRDLVQLAYRQGNRIALGPRGVLEGTGEPLCRVRMVPVTESVSVGDLLMTAGSEGIAAGGLLYGEVVRVDRPAGATHWDIWMEPATSGTWPDRVAVVTASTNDAPAAVMAGATATKGRQ